MCTAQLCSCTACGALPCSRACADPLALQAVCMTAVAAAGAPPYPCADYCYSADGSTLERCIAEVTNTPWGERVTFCFR